MKRRLSVAISLVGDPKVVYLDEPSTGGHAVLRCGLLCCAALCHAPAHPTARSSAPIAAGLHPAACQPLTTRAYQTVYLTLDTFSLPFLFHPGLDPASRQLLWNVIKQARKERAVVLTTHSMEEAEALCDRWVGEWVTEVCGGPTWVGCADHAQHGGGGGAL